jgi:maltose O-acetyltransferase
MNRTEKQKMLAGELYRPDAQLAADQDATQAWLARYNAALALPVAERYRLLCEVSHTSARTP